MKKTLAALFALVFIGAGCSYKYDAKWNDQDKAGMEPTSSSAANGTVLTGSCIVEGQPPQDGASCCEGLTEVAVDDAYSVCGKPGSGYKPRVCAAPGEIVTADTPNCCAGLDVVEKDNKFVCEPMK